MPHYSRLSSARDYLAARFNERTSLADAAAHAGLSPFYFQRLFAQAFGETPHEFVTRLRMEHAKKLLLAGNQQRHRHLLGCLLRLDAEATKAWDVQATRFRYSLTGLSPAAFRRESRRVFGTSGRHWPLYYMPTCFQDFFAGIS